MIHDFKKGDPVVLPDGTTGIVHSITVYIAEVEINKHYKYEHIDNLKHKENRAGESVWELESLSKYMTHVEIDKPGWIDSAYQKFMADGCDPEPSRSCDETGMTLGWRCMPGCKADDGPEVEILRGKL